MGLSISMVISIAGVALMYHLCPWYNWQIRVATSCSESRGSDWTFQAKRRSAEGRFRPEAHVVCRLKLAHPLEIYQLSRRQCRVTSREFVLAVGRLHLPQDDCDRQSYKRNRNCKH